MVVQFVSWGYDYLVFFEVASFSFFPLSLSSEGWSSYLQNINKWLCFSKSKSIRDECLLKILLEHGLNVAFNKGQKERSSNAGWNQVQKGWLGMSVSVHYENCGE